METSPVYLRKRISKLSFETMNYMKAGTSYGFTVAAKFEESSGTGKRNEARPCTVSFTKR